MGTVIVASSFLRPTGVTTHGARRLADNAIKQCLDAAGVGAQQVDLLVNAGVYRERGLGEPALAALIQEDVGANPVPRLGMHGTFSFDVDNGATGFLTGVAVLSGFLAGGAAEHAVVVVSDSAPGPLHTRGFPFLESGGAALLRHDDRVPGFVDQRFATFSEYAGLLEGYWDWESSRSSRYRGRNRLNVLERRGFRSRAVECAEEAAGKLLADHGLTGADIDLLIATPEPQFADPLAHRIGIDPVRAVHLGELLGRTHSAQPLAAIDVARRTGRWDEATNVLFVSAGAGITVGVALYCRR